MNQNCPHCSNPAVFLSRGRPVALANGWYQDVHCDACNTTRVLPCAAPGEIPTTDEPTRAYFTACTCPDYPRCRCVVGHVTI